MLQFSLCLLAWPAQAWDGMAVFGDSISTGAASHPALAYDSLLLWKAFTGEVDLSAKLEHLPAEQQRLLQNSLTPPQRLWPGSRQNDGGFGRAWLYTIQAFSRATLDTEEYSFGYLLGRSLGFAPQNIWIVGDNGSRAAHGVVQAARLLETSHGELPSHLLILFTGNDLCAATWGDMTSAESYGQDLRRTLQYLRKHGRSSEGKTVQLYLPAFLPITTLISSEAVASKNIVYYGEQTTCREARKRLFTASEKDRLRGPVDDSRYLMFSQMMPPNPALLCPTIYSTASSEPENLSILANRMRAYREQQQAVTESLNREWTSSKEKGPAMQIHYLASSAQINFEADDIAGDCFHLSAVGQHKLAKHLANDINSLK